MTTRRMTLTALGNLLNALTALGMWLKPGVFAFRVGLLRAPFLQAAEEAEKQVIALQRRYAVMDGEQFRTRTNEDGAKELVFDTPEDKAAFLAEQKAMNEQEVEVTLPFLLTEKQMETLEQYIIEDTAKRAPVDFAALLPVIDVAPAQRRPLVAGDDVKPHKRNGRLRNGTPALPATEPGRG